MKFSHHAIGHAAEARGARYLERLGFQIIDLNWRTRLCEIDIIAQKQNCVYFVEVKYRASNRWSSGLDQITRRKLRQMYLQRITGLLGIKLRTTAGWQC